MSTFTARKAATVVMALVEAQAMDNIPTLDDEELNGIMTVCINQANKMGLFVTIVIADASGHPLRLYRHVMARQSSLDMALQKARTAALEGRFTKEVEERYQKRPGVMKFEGYMPVQGGLPLFANGFCIGSIATSGGTSQQDEEISKTGIKWIKDEVGVGDEP